MVYHDILEPIIHSNRLPDLIEELNWFWQDEQRRRREFYEYIKPEDKAEYIDGEIIMHSPACFGHIQASGNLFKLIINHLDKDIKKGFLGYEKLLCRFTRNDYEPDICYFTPEKSDHFKKEQNIFPVPNFIIEILSSSTEKNDRGIKFIDYADHGVKEYWIIDPINNIVEQYVLENEKYSLLNKLSEGNIKSIVIENLEFSVIGIFE